MTCTIVHRAGAMGEYEIVLDQNPKHGWANYGLALILLRNKKQYELAVKKFRNAIESGSVKTANLYLNLARALYFKRRNRTVLSQHGGRMK
jgi:tetratricopeptide (TPR) repeat protein